MPEKVVVVRPDGTTLQTTPEQAKKLELLGYQVESGAAAYERDRERGREEYYSSTGQKVLAGLEAGARGVTLGASDFIIGDDATTARAQYNPGVALVGEIVGSVAPVLLSGGAGAAGAVARATPVGLLERAGVAAGKSLASGPVGRAAVAGTVEGAIGGVAAATSHAYLNNDPITVDAVASGLGWGALLGGGLGGVIGGRAAKKAEELTTAPKLTTETETGYRAMHDGVMDVRDKLDKAVVEIEQTVDNEVRALGDAVDPKPLYATGIDAKAYSDLADKVKWAADVLAKEGDDPVLLAKEINHITLKDLQRLVDMVPDSVPASLLARVEADQAAFVRAVERGSSALIGEARHNLLQTTSSAFKYLTKEADVPELLSQALSTTADSYKSFGRLNEIRTLRQSLSKFPNTREGFSSLSAEQVDEISEAVRNIGDVSVLEKADALGDLRDLHKKLNPPVTNQKTAFREMQAALQDVRRASTAAELDQAVARFKTSQLKVYEDSPGGLPGVNDPGPALKEVREMREVSKTLAKFPRTLDAFGKMSEEQVEGFVAAAQKARQLKSFPELAPSLDAMAQNLANGMGVKVKGMDDLRSLHHAAGEIANPPAKQPGILRKMIGTAVGAGTAIQVGAATGSSMAASAAFTGARAAVTSSDNLVQKRQGVLARLSGAAGKTATAVSKAARAVGPRVTPLAIAIDGTRDNKNAPKKELAAKRMEEFARYAQTINDRAYLAIEPLLGDQPELAGALHKATVDRFNTFRAMLPADPGVVSGLKSIWKPSDLQAAVIEKQYEVFVDPVGVAERMLSTGQYDAVQMKALKALNPGLFQHIRQEVLENISKPGVLDKMTINQQIGLGTLIDIPLHSSMRPEFIAASLQLHAKRSQPLPTPGMRQSSNGGRPSETNMTAAQKITEH